MATTLHRQLEEIVTNAQSVWGTQGRSEEQVYGVANFLTGRGGQPMLKEIEDVIRKLVERAYPDTNRPIQTQLEQAFDAGRRLGILEYRASLLTEINGSPDKDS